MKVFDLNQIDFSSAYDIQRGAVKDIISGEDSRIIFAEHPHVFTTGRNFHDYDLLVTREILKQFNITVCKADRGGGITYHGPGQIVCYPIINLNRWKKDIRAYIRALENIIIKVLGNMEIDAYAKKELTGVWLRDKKIASVGIGVSRWVTYHGFALNVKPDLKYFSLINSCGLKDLVQTSIGKETEGFTAIEKIKGFLIEEIEKTFQASMVAC